MTNFKKYINKIENQDFKEFTKYLDEDELIKLEYHFDNYAKQLSIQGVVVPKGTLCDFEWHNSDIRQAKTCSECGGSELK